MPLRQFITILFCIITYGCAITPIPPPSSQRIIHDPLLDRDGGVLLLVDVCIQLDAVGEDYFVVAESKAGAKALAETARKFLTDDAIVVTTELIPFVCGARHTSYDETIKVADDIDASSRDAVQPFDVAEELRSDPDYVRALREASTYMFERSLVTGASDDNSDAGDQVSQHLVSDEVFEAAISTIKTKTQASSILYLGVAGTAISTGKVVGSNIGSFITGMFTGVATGGTAFIPGTPIEGRLMGAGLVDLQSDELTWNNAIHVGGDCTDPDVIGNHNALNQLLDGLMYYSAPADRIPESRTQNWIDKTIAVMDVTGGIGYADKILKEAIIATIDQSKIFKAVTDDGSDLILNASIKMLDSKFNNGGLRQRVHLIVRYEIANKSDGRVLWAGTYQSEFTAEAFSGRTRAEEAFNGSIRENLALMLEDLGVR